MLLLTAAVNAIPLVINFEMSTHVRISVMFLLCFHVRLFIDAFWSPAEKGQTTWPSFVVSNCEIVTFPHWYPGSGVVLDCIDS